MSMPTSRLNPINLINEFVFFVFRSALASPRLPSLMKLSAELLFGLCKENIFPALGFLGKYDARDGMF